MTAIDVDTPWFEQLSGRSARHRRRLGAQAVECAASVCNLFFSGGAIDALKLRRDAADIPVTDCWADRLGVSIPPFATTRIRRKKYRDIESGSA